MSDTDFDTLFDDKARAAHAAGPVGYDEEGVRQAVRLFLKSIGARARSCSPASDTGQRKC